jgi:hypothetical protein
VPRAPPPRLPYCPARWCTALGTRAASSRKTDQVRRWRRRRIAGSRCSGEPYTCLSYVLLSSSA